MMWRLQLLSLVLMVGSLVVAEVTEQEAEKVSEEFVQELKAKIQESVQTIDEVFGKAQTTREVPIISRRSVGKRGWSDFFKGAVGVAAGGLLLGKKDSETRESAADQSYFMVNCGRDLRRCHQSSYLDSSSVMNKRKETAKEKQFKADLSRVSEAIDFLKGVVDVAILGA